MDILTAIIMGIVEGLTEFAPVSSTGHLILAGHLLDFTGESAKTFEIIIQLGSILAVIFVFWRRILSILGLKKYQDSESVGTSGKAIDRFADVTASARTFPDEI